jgi:hypothetical protein
MSCLLVCLPVYHFLFRLTYELEFDSYKDTNLQSKLILYLELKNQNAEKHEEYYVYDVVTFFAEFGGHVGLLLGFSSMSIYDKIRDTIVKQK